MISLFFGVSMIYYPRWRKLVACAKFKIQNSKFSSCPTRPNPPSLLNPPTCPTCPTIHNPPRTI